MAEPADETDAILDTIAVHNGSSGSRYAKRGALPEGTVQLLRSAHYAAIALYFILIVMIAVDLNSKSAQLSVDIYLLVPSSTPARFDDPWGATTRRSGTFVTNALSLICLIWSVFIHCTSVCMVPRRYFQHLDERRNHLQWTEYFVTYPLLCVIALQVCGQVDGAVQVITGLVCAALVYLYSITEADKYGIRRNATSVLGASCLFLAIILAVICMTFAIATSSGQLEWWRLSVFAYIIILSTIRPLVQLMTVLEAGPFDKFSTAVWNHYIVSLLFQFMIILTAYAGPANDRRE